MNTLTETYKIELSALRTAPIFDKRAHAKNWLAIIERDDSKRDGINRCLFAPHAALPYLYFVKGLQPGQAVEFGADYWPTSTKRFRNRAYGVIKHISVGSLVLIRTESALDALALAESIASKSESAEPVSSESNP